MNPALLFLARRSLVNGVRAKLARLKSPRYLIPFLLGAAYFTLYFGFLAVGSGPGRDGAPEGAGDARRSALFAEWIGTGIALAFACSAWLLPARKSPLAFLESEVALLFPAPLTRRELVAYKVLDLQKYLLLSGFFIALLLGLRSGPLRALTVFAGTWLFFGVLALHGIGAHLTRKSLLDHGVAGWKRMGVPVAVLAGVALTVILGMPPLPTFGAPGEGGRALAETRILDWLEALGSSPAGWVLLPLRLLGRPLLAPDLPSFLLSAGPALLIGILLFRWVVRTDAAFEEAAAEQAVEIGRRVEAIRAGKGWRTALGGPRPVRPAPWRLPLAGSPEGAFAWKSVAESVRTFSPRLLIFLFVAGVIGFLFARDMAGPEREGAIRVTFGAVLLALSALLVFGGPSLLGASLRQDLEQVEFLRTLPLTGGRLVRCTLAGAILPTAVLQVGMVALAAAILPEPPGGKFTLAWRLAGTGSLLLVLPAASAISALADATAALYFPAWVRPGQAPAQGPEAMGYGIVLMLGKGALLLAGLLLPAIPGAILVAAVAAWGQAALLPSAVLIAGLVVATGVAAETYLVSEVLGRRFEKLDAAEEGILS